MLRRIPVFIYWKNKEKIRIAKWCLCAIRDTALLPVVSENAVYKYVIKSHYNSE